MVRKKILIIGTKGASINMMFHSLENIHPHTEVIIEDSISALSLIKNRIKKLGVFKVIGQLIFQFFITPILRLVTRSRAGQILSQYNLMSHQIPDDRIHHVKTVNSQETIDIIKDIKPNLILLSGCRIISKKVLQNIDIPVLNIHAGITPKYRGVHGGYWALLSQDPRNFGVTLHHVDSGIDTGEIIAQKTIEFTSRDNFATYPLLQFSEGMVLLHAYIENISVQNIQPKDNQSTLWYHPTAWNYLYYRFFKGVK